MTYRTASEDPAQEQLAISLLDGRDPDAYVVMPIGDLVSQLQIALNETQVRGREYRPGQASVRLVRNLLTLGYVHDTAHPRFEDTP